MLFYVAIILAGFGTNTMTVGVLMLLSMFVAPAIVGAVMGFSYVFQNGAASLPRQSTRLFSRLREPTPS